MVQSEKMLQSAVCSSIQRFKRAHVQDTLSEELEKFWSNALPGATNGAAKPGQDAVHLDDVDDCMFSKWSRTLCLDIISTDTHRQCKRKHSMTNLAPCTAAPSMAQHDKFSTMYSCTLNGTE